MGFHPWPPHTQHTLSVLSTPPAHTTPYSMPAVPFPSNLTLLLLLSLLSFVISGQRTGLHPWQSHYFTARFLPSTSGQGSYIPSWGLADMGTMYKRDTAPKKSPSLWCEDEGSMCVVRGGGGGGIQGTLATRPCCLGTSCVFGRSAFYCVRDTEEEDYRDMGETQEDRTEHGPWST